MAAAPEQLVHYRIGLAGAAFSIGLAVVMDLGGFLLMLTGIGEIATEILGITGSIIFFLWYLFHGVSYTTGNVGRKLGIMGACSLVEWIPFVNGIMPSFTIETISMYITVRREDREQAAKKGASMNSTGTNRTSQRIQQLRAARFQRKGTEMTGPTQE